MTETSVISSTSKGKQDDDSPDREEVEARAASADFETIFREHYARVVAVLWRMVGNRAQAEELADDVFLKLHRQPWAERESRQHNWGGWLYRTATRAGIDALRTRARRQHYEAVAAIETTRLSKPDDPLEELLREECQRRVRAVLAKLKPAQAQLLILRSSGFSYHELAAALGVKPTSIGTLLARAETEFEKRYRQLYGSEEEV